MKFFTSEWWACGGADTADAVERYRSYFNSVRDQLPEAAITLDSGYTLHDSRLRHLHADAAGNGLVISLDGWDRDFHQRLRYTLRFAGVTVFNQNCSASEPVDPGCDDLGYWEWESLAIGFELRLLFASDAEWTIRFTDLVFEATPTEPDEAVN